MFVTHGSLRCIRPQGFPVFMIVGRLASLSPSALDFEFGFFKQAQHLSDGCP